MKDIRIFFRVSVFLTLSIIYGCSDSDSKQNSLVTGESFAVIAGVASDYSSSEISIANTASPYDVIEGYAAQSLSDITVATYGEQFYRIGRFNQDNITKYDFNNPSLVQWQFLTDDPASSPSNPYDLVFVSMTKAYVIRYGAPSIWIVDPSVKSSEGDLFKVGEIDLSAYDSDGIPQMSAAILHNNRLYVVMQVMDASFIPGDAYLAVIDTITDQEIDLDSEPLNGMQLNIKNPVELDIVDDSLLIAGAGRYERWWVPAPAEFTGGIEKININNFSSEILVDDGDEDTNPYGNINGMVLVSSTLGYFKGEASTGSSTNEANVYQFNPSNGVVTEPLTELADLDIQDMAVSPQGELWVGIGDASSPQIHIIDTNDNSIIDSIALSSNPSKIVFTSTINLLD
tara:strand:- start:39491 stop:40690 length:1200 start_codon:yes stop_codon:yes gene_type:complete